MNRTLVVFKVAGQSYCTDILKIKEVCMKQDIVAVPNAPSFVDGISNLRGEVICIVNLADKLGVKSNSDSKNQKNIIVSINDFAIGFLVDDISGIIHVCSDDIEVTPNILSKSNVFAQRDRKSEVRVDDTSCLRSFHTTLKGPSTDFFFTSCKVSFKSK